MSEPNNKLAPWDNETSLFDNPNAQCELTLDGATRAVSIILWEGYCYLKVSELNGLWAITRAYDETNLARFVAEQIEVGEVGRVWDFNHTYSNFDPQTRKFTAIYRNEPLVVLGLVAIVRFDNSAMVRNEEQPRFIETPAFDNNDRRNNQNLPATKANCPSIWHPRRICVGKQQIGYAARPLIFEPIPEVELQAGKSGDFAELMELLESLFICAAVQYRWQLRKVEFEFHWPSHRRSLRWHRDYQGRINLMPFLYHLWDAYHFKQGSWIPAKHSSSRSISNRRYEWQKAEDFATLTIPNIPEPTAYQKMEASLTVYNWFKDKTSERELNKLLPENL